jgi:hypothetical protein
MIGEGLNERQGRWLAHITARVIGTPLHIGYNATLAEGLLEVFDQILGVFEAD